MHATPTAPGEDTAGVARWGGPTGLAACPPGPEGERRGGAHAFCHLGTQCRTRYRPSGKCASTIAKNASRRPAERCIGAWLGFMSIETGLLIAAVVAVAAYLLAALIFPERF